MLRIIRYEDKYNEGVKALCRIPVAGDIELALEREPNYITAAYIQCEEPEIYVVLQDEEVLGAFNVGKRRLWHQQQLRWFRYMCDLRIHPAHHNGSVFYRMLRFYTDLAKDDKLPAQTIIFSDNHRFIHIVENRNNKGKNLAIPFYHPQATVTTHMLDTHSRIKNNLASVDIRLANKNDRVALQKFMDDEGKKIELFPYYELSKLGTDYYKGLQWNNFYIAEKNGEIIAVVGTWDLSFCKQTIIKAYHGKMKWAKPFFNVIAPLLKRNKLPKENTKIDYLHLHSILIKDRNKNVFSALLERIIQDAKEYNFLLCSLDKKDPLHDVAQGFKKAIRTEGKYYLVNYNAEGIGVDGGKGFCYVEAARI